MTVKLHPAISPISTVAISCTFAFGFMDMKLVLAMMATLQNVAEYNTLHPILLLTLTWLIGPENCLFHKSQSSAMLVDC
jgi:hypothetical protein